MHDRVPLPTLRDLADATHAKKVCRWLEQNGIPYRLDCNGQPIVLQGALDQAFNPAAQQPIAGELVLDFTRMEAPRHGKKESSRRRPA